MDIQQSFSVPFPLDAVWRVFHDTAGLVACLPGAALADGWQSAPEGRLPLSMTVKLGPIVAAFAGEGALTLDEASRSGAVAGSGADRKSGSRVKGEAAFSLHPADEASGACATRVDIVVAFSIAGSLAQFSRGGIVRELAARLTDAFADNLKQKLEAEAAAAPPAGPAASGLASPVAEAASAQPSQGMTAAPAVPAARPRTAPASAPLDLGALFWPALWARLRQMLGLQPRR